MVENLVIACPSCHTLLLFGQSPNFSDCPIGIIHCIMNSFQPYQFSSGRKVPWKMPWNFHVHLIVGPSQVFRKMRRLGLWSWRKWRHYFCQIVKIKIFPKFKRAWRLNNADENHQIWRLSVNIMYFKCEDLKCSI